MKYRSHGTFFSLLKLQNDTTVECLLQNKNLEYRLFRQLKMIVTRAEIRTKTVRNYNIITM